MKEIIINELLKWAIPIIVGTFALWLQGRSARAQKWAALGGQVAKEAVLIAAKENPGAQGLEKAERAVDIFNTRMEAMGHSVPDQVVREQVKAAHIEMSLDKTTAYNEKPCITPAQAEINGLMDLEKK